MKILTPLLVLFVALSASAQYGQLDPARQAERDAVYGPGYLTPGNADVYRPGRPGRPGPPMPPPRRPPGGGGGHYPPPPPPAYGGDVGPQYTVRWQDNGVTRLSKIINETINVYIGGALTNEVLVRAIDNRVSIESVLAYLQDGRVVDLRNLTGTLREGQELRSLVDYRYSLRISRIEIRASSENLIGSRAQLQVMVGLAQ